MVFIGTEENIAFDQCVIAVTHGQRAARFVKRIIADDITARFAGNDFQLTVATVKIIILHDGFTVGSGKMAGADAQCFATIGTQYRARAKIIMVNAVIVFTALSRVQLHRHRHALVSLTHQMAMVKAIILAIKHDPKISLLAFRLIEIIDNDFGHT